MNGPAAIGTPVLDAPIRAETLPLPASSAEVVEVIGSSGVRAYLVPDRSLPFVSLAFQFRAGATFDPGAKCGLAVMLAGLLDEGAGDLDSQGFHQLLEDNAIRLSFDGDRDTLNGNLKTLNATREQAFELLRLALTAARFDSEPVERVRSQMRVELERRATNPNYVASRAWFERAFGDHPYARATNGALETLGNIDVDDLKAARADRLARDNLALGVAGDIEPAELRELVDRTFGELPETARLPQVPTLPPRTGDLVTVPMNLPQSVAVFGLPGIARHDPDYYAAYIANYILGGGGFSSRLMQEVREARGLAYSVHSYLYDGRFSPLWLGGVATSNERVAQSIEIVAAEMKRLAAGEVGETDLGHAKTYLTGSFALRLTSNDQVARMLVGMMANELGADYLDRRNSYIEAVTLEDVRRASARMLAGEPLVAVVGAPVGLEPSA